MLQGASGPMQHAGDAPGVIARIDRRTRLNRSGNVMHLHEVLLLRGSSTPVSSPHTHRKCRYSEMYVPTTVGRQSGPGTTSFQST